MKILRVKGKNLASIAGEFEIDFTCEPLCSAGIFAISGPTGSGKSTILDAICLALYNNTPRTTGIENAKVPDVGSELIQQGDKRQILRRGATEAYASVEFRAIDGKTYRSVWKVRRAGNKAMGKLQPVEFLLYEAGNLNPLTDRITETENKLILLTGLTFNQFTRTVLLAQNEFARFLKARKEEKAEVLEKLTGTEIYSSISNIIYTKTAALRSEWKETNTQLKQIQLLSKEELQSLQEQVKNISIIEVQLQTKQQALQLQIKWLEHLKALQLSQQEASIQLQHSEKAIEEFHPRSQWLCQIEQVESSRSYWREKNELSASLLHQHSLLEQCIEKKKTQTQEAAHIEDKYNSQKQLVCRHTQEYEQLKPFLIQARRLDIELKHAHQRLQEQENSLMALLKDKEEAEEQQRKRTAALEHTEKQLTQVQLWFEKNKLHEEMCLNMNMILSLFESISSIQKQIENYSGQSAEIQKSKQTSEQHLQSITHSYELTQQELTETGKQRNLLQQQIAKIPIAALRKKYNTLRRQKELLSEAQSRFESLLHTRQKLQQLQLKIKEKQEYGQTLLQELNQNQTHLKAAEIKYHTLRQSFEKAQTTASASVTELRMQLKEKCPCPVCGSTNHPYTQEKVITTSVLNTLKADLEQAEKQYNIYKIRNIQLVSEQKQLQEILFTLSNEAENDQRVCEESVKHWYQHASELNFPIDITLEQLSLSVEKLQEKIQQISQQENEWEKLDNELQELNKTVEQFYLQSEMKQKERQEIIQEINKQDLEISKNSGMLEKLNSQKREILIQLHTYISIPDWESQWTTSPIVFKEKLVHAFEKWQHKTEEKQLLEKRQNQLLSEQKEATKNLSLFLRNETEIRGEQAKSLQQFKLFQKERQALLQGLSADETEKHYQLLIRESTQKLEELNSSKERLSGELQKLIGEELQLKKNVSEQKLQLEASALRLTQWLQAYNTSATETLNEETLTQLLVIPANEIQHFKKIQKQLKENYTITLATYQERNLQLKKHVQTAPPLVPGSQAELEMQQTELQQKNEELLQQKTKLLAQLHIQQENRQQAHLLLEKLEKKSGLLNQWSKLDELIGSQSGYKFKEIAQGYTLDILLSYANKQLHELTPRYQLQRVPDELAIQITDHDLCDEVRSVFSLSGGESFIVSLALALGLSSFSANNHYEENLFIDEGFGTLDSETLQVVMEALERLRSQGRQVGIISHVRELTERIPARINLKKLGNGKSKVEI